MAMLTLTLTNNKEENLFSLEFDIYHAGVGLVIIDESNEEKKILLDDEQAILFTKDDARHLISYLTTAFEL